MAVVLVSLIMMHPTEVKAEDLSVGVITVNYQNTEYGSCSSDKTKVSLIHASNFKYNFQCVKNGKQVHILYVGHLLAQSLFI